MFMLLMYMARSHLTAHIDQNLMVNIITQGNFCVGCLRGYVHTLLLYVSHMINLSEALCEWRFGVGWSNLSKVLRVFYSINEW